MRAASLLSCVLISVACAPAARHPASAPPESAPRLEVLSTRLHERIARAPGTVALVLIDLGTGDRIRINQHVRMHAASTMKVPVMLELVRQAAEGRYALSDSIRVTNSFMSIADGSRYTLSPEEDSDDAIYRMVGGKMTIGDLTRRMITRSSNLATNILIQTTGAAEVRETMRAIGAGDMHVLRGVQDIPAYRRGMNNTTTAAAFARVLEIIARCASPELPQDFPARLASVRRENCRTMVDILADQHFNSMIPAGLPEGVRVAHKTGSITEIHHDGAIVYPDGRSPYVLVVLTHGIEDSDRSAGIAADLSRMVWQALAGSRPEAGRANSTRAAAPEPWPVPPRVDPRLQAELERIVRGFGGEVGIYVRHLATGQSAAIHADSLFPTASLIKVPILLTTFARIEQGALDYRQELAFHDSLRYEAPGDLLYWFRDGANIRLNDVIMLMLTVSDNTAALWLQQLVGRTASAYARDDTGREDYWRRWGRGGAAVNSWLAAHGFERTRSNSGVPGRRAPYDRYGWGQTTPRDMAEMLVRIRTGKAVSPEASAEMYRALSGSFVDGVALSQIPPTIEAASKQGWVSESRSEVVLVNAPHGDYVFCVITKHQQDTSSRHDNEGLVLIRDVSRLLWNYFEPESNWEPAAGRETYY